MWTRIQSSCRLSVLCTKYVLQVLTAYSPPRTDKELPINATSDDLSLPQKIHSCSELSLTVSCLSLRGRSTSKANCLVAPSTVSRLEMWYFWDVHGGDGEAQRQLNSFPSNILSACQNRGRQGTAHYEDYLSGWRVSYAMLMDWRN